MRTFIAVFPSEEALNELVKAQSHIEDNGIKLIPKEQLHLTIKFLGDIKEPEKIIEALNQVKFESFETSLDKGGVFSEKFLRVAWIDLSPKDQLRELTKKINTTLPSFKEKRLAYPHITIARIKHLRDREPFIENHKNQKGFGSQKSKIIEEIKNLKIKPVSFEVSNFKLMKSTLTPEGPVYEEIKSFTSS